MLRGLIRVLDGGGPCVNIVRLTGAITPPSARIQHAGVVNLKSYDKVLKRAFESSNETKAVVLIINSPGGSPVQSRLQHDRLLSLKKKHDMPLNCIVEDLCASGWLQCCNMLFASHHHIQQPNIPHTNKPLGWRLLLVRY